MRILIILMVVLMGAAGITARTADAQPQPSGHVELFAGWERWAAEQSCTPTCFAAAFNGWQFGAAGRVNWWLSSNSNLQLDLQGDGTLYDPGSSRAHNYAIAAHTGWRDPGTSLGIVAAIGGMAMPTTRWALIGFEGLGNWNQLTLITQAGFVMTLYNQFNPGHGMFVRGTGRFYPTQNSLLEGTVMATLATTSVSPIYSAVFWLFRVKAETLIKPNLSIYVAYQGWFTYFSPVPGTTAQTVDNRVMVGSRFFFGGDSLRNNDINGAPFDVINPFGLYAYPHCCPI